MSLVFILISRSLLLQRVNLIANGLYFLIHFNIKLSNFDLAQSSSIIIHFKQNV